MSFSARLWATVGLAWLALASLALVYAWSDRANMIENRQRALAEQIDAAISIVNHYRSLADKGALSADQAKTQALAALRDYRYGTDGYVSITTSSPMIILSPSKPSLEQKDASGLTDKNGTHLILNVVKADEDGTHLSYYVWPKLGSDTPVDKMSVSGWVKEWDWHIYTGAYMDDIHDQFVSRLVRALSLVGAIGVALTLAMVWVIRRTLASLGGDPDYAKSVCSEIAEGNLAVAIKTSDADSSSLLFELKAMQMRLVDTVGGIKRIADSITSAAGEIAKGNQDLSSRTEEQAASLEETASSMEELTGTVRQTAGNATQASSLAADSANVAHQGKAAMQQVIATMGTISEASAKIDGILSVIESIAFQTNILALNAAVESARAGEHGRGFAVVASEVRSLAQRSASAAKEIKTLIGDSVDCVQVGSAQVNSAGETMEAIVGSISRVNRIMSEIAEASGEQSIGIEQVGRAVQQMDEVTQQNAALVEQAAAASGSLEDQAKELARSVSMFRLPRAV
jgi:methyl-accepting chemotaxis protein